MSVQRLTCEDIKAQKQVAEPEVLESVFAGQQNARPDRKVVNPDQEAWVKQTVLSAIRAAYWVEKAKRVRADQPITDCAIEGIVNGAVVEIIHSLDLEPGYVNLQRPKAYLLEQP